jgi:DNA-3-methyladenine glycosylase
MPVLPKSFYLRPTLEVARDLLGCFLFYDGARARIVEVEGYLCDDEACHASRGETPRNATMFREGGRIYIYRSYGIHFCANAVTGPAGIGEAVLLRSAEPLEGIDLMRGRRGAVPDHRLLAGPGNLTKGLGLSTEQDNYLLTDGVLRIEQGEAVADGDVVQTTRIGLTKNVEAPWRYYVRGSRCVSRK